MHELWDMRPWPRALLRYPLLILTTLLLGALLGFSYSYAPLHRAKDWKIDHLEKRLTSRNEQLTKLEENLAQTSASLSGTLTPEEIAAIRTQLREATRLADATQREVSTLQKRLERATKSRDRWRSRHEAAIAVKPEPAAPPHASADAPGGAPPETAEKSLPASPTALDPTSNPDPSSSPVPSTSKKRRTRGSRP